MRTLYVSDLDGTLLRSDERTSGHTNRIINELVAGGVFFSYATARSYHTARRVTAGMNAPFPLIVYNGAVIRDNATGELLTRNTFDKKEAERLILDLTACAISPIVYSFVDGNERFSYDRNTVNAPTGDFIRSRRGDERDRPVSSPEELLAGDVFYVTCIGSPEKLGPVRERYAGSFHCVYQRDIYSGEQWLEIMPRNVSKAGAAARLKELLGCGRLVAFGDGINDLELFGIADEAYAVENAAPELKAAATGVIGPNDEDSVAEWLYRNAEGTLAPRGTGTFPAGTTGGQTDAVSESRVL